MNESRGASYSIYLLKPTSAYTVILAKSLTLAKALLFGVLNVFTKARFTVGVLARLLYTSL